MARKNSASVCSPSTKTTLESACVSTSHGRLSPMNQLNTHHWPATSLVLFLGPKYGFGPLAGIKDHCLPTIGKNCWILSAHGISSFSFARGQSGFRPPIIASKGQPELRAAFAVQRARSASASLRQAAVKSTHPSCDSAVARLGAIRTGPMPGRVGRCDRRHERAEFRTVAVSHRWGSTTCGFRQQAFSPPHARVS